MTWEEDLGRTGAEQDLGGAGTSAGLRVDGRGGNRGSDRRAHHRSDQAATALPGRRPGCGVERKHEKHHQGPLLGQTPAAGQTGSETCPALSSRSPTRGQGHSALAHWSHSAHLRGADSWHRAELAVGKPRQTEAVPGPCTAPQHLATASGQLPTAAPDLAIMPVGREHTRPTARWTPTLKDQKEHWEWS